MIKEKFLSVLMWLRDNLHFLLEVVIRLSVGVRNKTIQSQNQSKDEKDVTHPDKEG